VHCKGQQTGRTIHNWRNQAMSLRTLSMSDMAIYYQLTDC